MADVYSVAHRHQPLQVGKGDKLYVPPGWYSEMQLMYMLRKLHAQNFPKPCVHEAWKEEHCHVCEEVVVEAPVEVTPVEPTLFDRLVDRVVMFRDALWSATLETFKK
jgi:hypothetical protein